MRDLRLVVPTRSSKLSRSCAKRRTARGATGRVSDAAAASTERPEWSVRGSVSISRGDDAEGALGSGVGEERGVRGVPPYGRAREGGEVEGTARARLAARDTEAKDAHTLAHPREACERAAGTIAGTSVGTVGSIESVGFAREAVDRVRLEVGGGDLELAPRLGVRIVLVEVGVDVFVGAVLGSRRAGLLAGEVGAGRGIAGMGRGVARPALRARLAARAAPLVLLLFLLTARDDVVAVARRLEREERRGERPRVGVSVGVARPGPGPRRAGALPFPFGGVQTLPRGVASRVPPLRARARGVELFLFQLATGDALALGHASRRDTHAPIAARAIHETARADQHHDTPALGTSNTRPSDQRLGRAERADDR